jgi:hypothetical protein
MPARRPAETAGLAGAVVVLIAYRAGVSDPAVIVALTIVVGAVPAAVTWLVETLRRPKPDASA